MNEQLKLEGQTTNAIGLEWSFCDVNYLTAPAKEKIVSSFGAIYNSRFVQNGPDVYLFFVSQTQNKLISLRFIDPLGLDFEVHSEIDLSQIVTNPAGIDVVNENGTWSAIITSIVSPFKLVTVDFAENFQSITSHKDLSSLVSLSTPFDVRVIRHDGNYVGFVTNSTGPVEKQVARLVFGSSFDNLPAVDYVALPSGSGAASIEVYNGCENWAAFVSSRNGKLFRVDLGSNPATAVPQLVELALSTALNDPGGLALLEDHDELVLLLQSRNGNTYAGRLASVSDNTVEITNFGNIKSTTRDWGIEVFRVHGDYKIVSANFSGGTIGGLHALEFVSKCPANKNYSVAKSEIISFHEPGVFKVTLRSMNAKGEFLTDSKQVVVSSLPAPELTIAKPDVYCVNSSVAFTVTSNLTLADQAWNFGDGVGASSESSPVYSYVAAGVYNVSVDATSENGCRNFDATTIEIFEKPTADFLIPSGLMCTNNYFTFQTSTTDIFDGHLTYQWFVEGMPVSNDRDLTYEFDATGEKQITLQTSIPGCMDQAQKATSFVEAGPLVDFTYVGSCEDEAYTFAHQITESVTSFYWDFDNGNTSTDAHPTQIFSESGDFSVSLTATSDIGCQNKKVKVIAVGSIPWVDFVVSGPPDACSNKIVLFENATTNPDGRPIARWLWQFNDPNNAETHNEINGQHLFSEAGTYPVSLTATTTAGCSATLEKEITILSSPTTDFTHTPACEDVPVTFIAPPDATIESSYWEIGTSYSYAPSPTYTFAAPGDYLLYAEFYGSNGCISTVERTIHVPQPLIPDFSVIKNCVDHEAIFTDITMGVDPVATRTWNFGDGFHETTSPVNHLFAQQGLVPVTLQVITKAGCSYATTREVEILPAPVAEFLASPQTGAYPLDVSFTNTSIAADRFEWRFSDETESASGDESPAYTFSTLGTFDVILTAYNGQQCQDSFTQSISTVAPLPDADVEMIKLVGQADGSTKVIITIRNKGNTILKNLPMMFDFSGGLSLSQMVTEPIMPGVQFNFILSTTILNAETLTYFCVALDVENDLSPEGNRSCSALDADFYVFPAYPNPASDGLRLEWLSQHSGSVTVLLLDRLGRTIFRDQLTDTPGLNSHFMDLVNLPAGLYLLLVDDGSSKKVQRITVER